MLADTLFAWSLARRAYKLDSCNDGMDGCINIDGSWPVEELKATVRISAGCC